MIYQILFSLIIIALISLIIIKYNRYEKFMDLNEKDINENSIILNLENNLKNLKPIPKNLFISWKNKDFYNSQNPLILNGIGNFKNINPDWTINLYDDKEIDDYLKKKLNKQDYILIKNRKIVEKVDLWRLMILHEKGGMYMDLDRFYNKDINKIIQNKKEMKMCLPTYKNMNFSQDIIISSPKNPIILSAINLNIKRRRDGIDSIVYLGPSTYMHAVSKKIYGKELLENPDIQILDKIRNALEKSPYTCTFIENPPNYTITFDKNISWKKGNGGSKNDFYNENSVTHHSK